MILLHKHSLKITIDTARFILFYMGSLLNITYLMKITTTPRTTLYCTLMHNYETGENYINSCVIDRESGLKSGFIKGLNPLKNFLSELLDDDRITWDDYETMTKAARKQLKEA